METKRTPLYLGESSHTHRCAVCETDIPCDSPEDPQGCMVNALTCGDCDDISQTLPSTGSGDYEPDDGFMPQDSDADNTYRDQDTADSFEDLLQGDDHRIEDYDAVGFFESMLQGNDHSDEEWFPEAQTKPENPSTSPARRGGWKKKGRGKR